MVARDGDNVVHRSEAMPWYDGPSVMEAIGELELATAPVDALRFPVQGVLRHDGPATVVGRVLSGSVAEGDALTVCPGGAAVTVRAIRRFPEDHAPAQTGESVGLVLDGPEPSRGDVLAPAGDLPQVTRTPAGRVFWLAEAPLALGEEVALRCATQVVPVRVEAIADRLDSATLDPLPAGGGPREHAARHGGLRDGAGVGRGNVRPDGGARTVRARAQGHGRRLRHRRMSASAPVCQGGAS